MNLKLFQIPLINILIISQLFCVYANQNETGTTTSNVNDYISIGSSALILLNTLMIGHVFYKSQTEINFRCSDCLEFNASRTSEADRKI